jgi:hypothetical protein
LRAGQQFDLNQRRPYKTPEELVMPVVLPNYETLERETERRALARAGDGVE